MMNRFRSGSSKKTTLGSVSGASPLQDISNGGR